MFILAQVLMTAKGVLWVNRIGPLDFISFRNQVLEGAFVRQLLLMLLYIMLHKSFTISFELKENSVEKFQAGQYMLCNENLGIGNRGGSFSLGDDQFKSSPHCWLQFLISVDCGPDSQFIKVRLPLVSLGFGSDSLWLSFSF